MEDTTAHIGLDIRVTQGGYPGVGRATTGLAQHLLTLDRAHRFALLHRDDRDVPAQIVDAVRPPHHLQPVTSRQRRLSDQFETPLRLRQSRIDLYHSPYFAMAWLPGIPYVVSLHDTIPVLFPDYWSPFQGGVIRTWQRRVATNATRVITGSAAAARDISTYYSVRPERIDVTPWAPVEWSAASEETLPRSAKPYMLCVCTNKPHKNLTRLVRGFVLAAHQGANVNLVIAGGWSDAYPEAEEAAIESGMTTSAIRFVKNPSDGVLRFLYEHALAFIFPSLYEGFGLPVLEAMQAGLPVAASTTAAVAEVAGDAALLFDPLNEHAIAAAILSLSTGDSIRRRLRKAGLTQLARFSWASTAELTYAAYEAALCA